MKFSEEDLQSYAFPLGENVKEQCFEVLRELLQALKEMGCQEKAVTGIANLVDFKAILEHKQWGALKVIVMGAYGNDTRGDKKDILEIGLITTQPIADLGKLLSYKLLGGFSEEEGGLGSIFIDIGPAKATVVRIGYRASSLGTDAVAFSYNKKKIICFPEQEKSLAAEYHKATNYSYKKLVRVLKKLHSVMCDAGCASAKQVEPFMLERLLLALGLQKLQHFNTLSEKLKYCCLELALLLEKTPDQLRAVDKQTQLLHDNELPIYQKFFAELQSFCKLE